MTVSNSLITRLESAEHDRDFIAWLRSITDQLDQPALGITLQVLDQGLSSLSPKQRYVFEQFVIEEHAHDRCNLCSQHIPWCEMSNASDSGLCAYCENTLSKD